MISPEIISVLKEYWWLFVATFIPIRLVELILRLIARRLFGAVLTVGRVVTKPLGAVKRVSMFEWVLMLLLLLAIGYIFYTKSLG